MPWDNRISAFSGGSVFQPVGPPASVAWDLSGNTVAQYDMEDDAASTVVTDTEGTNGTASVNTDQLSIAGKVGDAFEFTGLNTEYFSANQTFQSTFRSDFSLATWFYPSDSGVTYSLFGSRNALAADAVWFYYSGSGFFGLQYASNGTNVYAIYDGNIFPGATSWKHVAATVSSTEIKLFLNGSRVGLSESGTGDMSAVVMGDWTSTYDGYVGAQNNEGSPSTSLNGSMDNFRVINKELTQTEINGIYNGGAGTAAQSSS